MVEDVSNSGWYTPDMDFNVDVRRCEVIRDSRGKSGPVVYWMNRDQRVQDNWALLRAQEVAVELNQPLIVVHNLLRSFLGGGKGHYAFKVLGLQQVERDLAKLNIPFVVYEGAQSHRQIAKLAQEVKAGLLVTDMSPLRLQRQWLDELIERIKCGVEVVDTHNIVPVWVASQKQEYAAYTIRPRIHKVLGEWLTDIPPLKKHPVSYTGVLPKPNWKGVENPYAFKPGEKAGMAMLKDFIDNRLPNYAEMRNNPNADALSDLSPYFHYGQLAPQRAAWEVSKESVSQANIDTFIEEAVVRRELSDNFCYYNPDYDNVNGFHAWTKTTIAEHRLDDREYIYSLDQFEQADTHDPLWNAAQQQMVVSGKMHGYMRMYWAKKILEWTPDVESAMQYAITLNDRYSLDGRDPNGYVGIAWSIGGVHDRAWPERPVFGKIRYMNFNGCKRKFDVAKYIDTWSGQSSLI